MVFLYLLALDFRHKICKIQGVSTGMIAGHQHFHQENTMPNTATSDNPETNQDCKPLFVQDKPIDSRDQDKFGHAEIADSLCAMIDACETPFTIGLFGGWGSGKTGITKLVTKELTDKKNTLIILRSWSLTLPHTPGIRYEDNF